MIACFEMESLKNTILAVVSALVVLLVLEGFLKTFIDPTKIYSNIHGVSELSEMYNEVRFWSRHRKGRDFAGNHDAKLGWDRETTEDRIRGARKILPQPNPNDLRIVAIGDSFTYGIDVEADENYPALLDAMVGIEALNMGIPGYGIDQAFLKYMEYGRQYAPDVVIFGIYVSDYERTGLGFSYFAKPQFLSANGEIVLAGQPVPSPEQEVARIGQMMDGKIYLLELLRNVWRKSTVSDEDRAEFFAHTDAAVRHILRNLQASLADSQKLIVLHIPRAESFIETNEFRNEMSRRLLALYKEAGVHHIDLSAEFVADRDGRAAYQAYFAHFPDGSVGHFSPAGHARVVELILAALDEPEDSQSRQ